LSTSPEPTGGRGRETHGRRSASRTCFPYDRPGPRGALLAARWANGRGHPNLGRLFEAFPYDDTGRDRVDAPHLPRRPWIAHGRHSAPSASDATIRYARIGSGWPGEGPELPSGSWAAPLHGRRSACLLPTCSLGAILGAWATRLKGAPIGVEKPCAVPHHPPRDTSLSSTAFLVWA